MITNERTLKKIVVMGSGVIIFARVPSSSAIKFFCIGNDWPVAVKIQNRGPEQEIPAVTCVRLIAQKHRY